VLSSRTLAVEFATTRVRDTVGIEFLTESLETKVCPSVMYVIPYDRYPWDVVSLYTDEADQTCVSTYALLKDSPL
jgi:hypothetical protein